MHGGLFSLRSFRCTKIVPLRRTPSMEGCRKRARLKIATALTSWSQALVLRAARIFLFYWRTRPSRATRFVVFAVVIFRRFEGFLPTKLWWCIYWQGSVIQGVEDDPREMSIYIYI